MDQPSNTSTESTHRLALPSQNEDMWISLTGTLRLLRKHLILILACWLLCVAAVAFWSLGQPRIYRAEALLRLNPDPPKPLGNRVELPAGYSNYWGRREFYESEFKVMRSMRVASAVVRRLGLHADTGFLHIKPNAKQPFKPMAVEDAAEILIARLTVDPIKDSNLVYLRYEDTDPKRCQSVLNTIVEVYLEQNLENISITSSKALEKLNGQLEQLQGSLKNSETALNDFRKSNNILSISLEERSNLLASELEMITKQITSVDIRRIELAARNAELAKISLEDPTKLPSNELLGSPVLSAYRTSYAEQYRVLSELTATLGEEHPKVKSTQAKLDATAKSIRAELSNIKESLSKDLKVTERQLHDLRVRSETLQKLAHDLQGFETTYNQLKRTKTYDEKIYGLVLERVRETDVTRTMFFNNITTVDDAREPKGPIRPKIPTNIAIGAGVGLFFGIAAAFLRELSDRTVKTPSDVEETLGVACLGMLPQIERAHVRKKTRASSQLVTTELKDRDLVVFQHPDGGVAEASRVIRTNLMFSSPDKPYRSLLVTSAVPEEGKTTVVCSLSTVLAQSGLHVLIVDTDLRKPRLHRTFRVSNDLGVSMLVSGQATLDESIQSTAIPNVSILTSGPIPPNPAEMLQSERFRDLTRELLQKFDRVVFDSSPVLPVTDAAILSRLVDGVILVGRGARTTRTVLRQAVRRLSDVNTAIIGIVLNAIDLRKHDYKEYYYYRKGGYYGQSESDSKTEIV